MSQSDDDIICEDSEEADGESSAKRKRPNNPTVDVKWTHEGTRRFSLSRDKGYTAMMRKIAEVMPNFSGNLCWKDESNDKIDVNDDEEFAYGALRQENLELFHLFTSGLTPGFSIYTSQRHVWADTKSAVLGNGKFSKVLKGHEKRTGKFVAIKVFKDPKNAEDKTVYKREYEMVKSLANEFIVRYNDMEEFTSREDNKIHRILVMELADGSVRSELLNPEHRFGLPYQLLFAIIESFVKALKYLAGANIVHRNVNPNHMLIFKKPSLTCKLCDFANAYQLGSIEEPSVALGSSAYLSSGILRSPKKKFCPEDDNWAAACSFFECATGRQPFITEFVKNEEERVNLEGLVTLREEGTICGERKLKPDKEGKFVHYSPDMPLQHYSYSRSLKCILAQFFRLLFAKNKLYLPFKKFSEVCEALTSLKLKGHKFYNVSELCIDEYFDNTESASSLFTKKKFHDEVLGNDEPQFYFVEILHNMNAEDETMKFRPSNKQNPDELVVWKCQASGEIQTKCIAKSIPSFDQLKKPFDKRADPADSIGRIVQMQMHVQQMRLFHDGILRFCRRGHDDFPSRINRPGVQPTLLDKVQPLFPPDAGYDYGQQSNIMQSLPSALEVTTAQKELLDIPEGLLSADNALFKANCKLIQTEYAEAGKLLEETANIVKERVDKIFEPELLNLKEFLVQRAERDARGLAAAYSCLRDDEPGYTYPHPASSGL